MAGIACARTLLQAGHAVTVFEKSRGPGGRMATRRTEFGSFDHGVQYFTVRDARFKKALAATAAPTAPWQVNTVRIMDEAGRVVAAAGRNPEAHHVATPGLSALVQHWAAPIEALHRQSLVTRIEPDRLHKSRWQLHTEGPGAQTQIHAGFDAVLLALPSIQAATLLRASQLHPELQQKLDPVQVAPCWTLMLAFPQAMQPGMNALGPQWNAARSTHHRIAWLARESSKPGREQIERWTVQASAAWSQEHLEDDTQRVQGKLLKAFSEVTGIRAEPAHVDTQRWRYAQTTTPLGQSHLWDAKSGLGACGDWCLGHRVENAFVSGLELALAVA
jgi:predicted NAD/FAD-dependent oxidoreductase